MNDRPMNDDTGRGVNGKWYWWEGHYLVDERRYCPHGVFVEYRCDGCDADYGWQGKEPSERKVTR